MVIDGNIYSLEGMKVINERKKTEEMARSPWGGISLRKGRRKSEKEIREAANIIFMRETEKESE